MTRPRPGRRRSAAVLVVLVLALLTGCVRMPTQGPVVKADPLVTDADDSAAFYDPRPPEPGADPEEIVLGFLEAMKATPVRTSVAAGFLSESAQRSWRPEDATLTYADHGPPTGSGEIELQFVGAQSYDTRGRWRRALEPEEATLSFPMTLEGEEWRIDAAPNALVVPQAWFEEWFERASLHFLDPTQSLLVPEPVVVPSGDQMATALVRGLLAGPPRPRVSRSAFPRGARLALNSVPIEDGVADVVLERMSGRLDEVATAEMVAQLAWTLRRVPQLTHFRLTVDERPVTLADGPPEISVSAGQTHSPLGATTERDLFALSDDRLLQGGFANFSATSGPWGSDAPAVRSLALSLDGSVVVGVTEDGTGVLRAPTNGEGETVAVLSGATDVLPPSVDFADRTWLVDRSPAGARVLLLDAKGEVTQLEVPGISGRNVVQVLVSRDSSRLVAVVRGAGRDRVLVSRVAHSPSGGRPRFLEAREIEAGVEPARRVIDIGWRSPVTLAVLSNVTPEVAQVRVVPVDGSPGDVESPGAARVRGRALGVVVSPAEGDGVYVITREEILDLTRPTRDLPLPGEQVTWFGFVG